MRLLSINQANGIQLTSRYYHATGLPRYAILSHTWSPVEEEEVFFHDIQSGTAVGKPGYQKLMFCATRARHDGIRYFWIDTCCINSQDNTEVQEAINSMWRWYQGAAKCYVYLTDVRLPQSDASSPPARLSLLDEGSDAFQGIQGRHILLRFQDSRWFKRGWTLQELLAPPLVEFFTNDGSLLGTKVTLQASVSGVTGIPVAALEGSPLSTFSIDERMRWAEGRETKREEDQAYSLLGIFDIFMPLIYGEGKHNAFKRLRKELEDVSTTITRHETNLAQGVMPARFCCTFEPGQLDLMPSLQSFLRFQNGISFAYTPDDQLIIQHRNGKIVWQNDRRNVPFQPAKRLLFQTDGNMVTYNDNDEPTWDTGTQTRKAAELVLSSAKPYIQIVDWHGEILYRS